MRFTIILLLIILIGCSEKKPTNKPKHEPAHKAVQLHPDFPIVENLYQMTEEWSVTLPTKFNRRIEDGSLVIWKPGFTIWTTVWNNDHSETQEERLASIKADSSPKSFDSITETTDKVVRYSYSLKEGSDDNRQPAFYCFAVGIAGNVQMAIYYDSPEDLTTAKAIWRSLNEKIKAENKSQ